MAETRQPTRGELVVGITFNVGGRGDVHECKQRFADAIDQLYTLEEGASDFKRELIIEAQKRILDAQMWAVKAITA